MASRPAHGGRGNRILMAEVLSLACLIASIHGFVGYSPHMSGYSRSAHKSVKYAAEEPQCQSEDTHVTCWGDGELFRSQFVTRACMHCTQRHKFNPESL